MSTTPTPPTNEADRLPSLTEPVAALPLVRGLRDAFAARSAGLSAEELITLIRRDAAWLADATTREASPEARSA